MEKSATLVAFLVVVVVCKTSTGPAVFVYIQIKPQTNKCSSFKIIKIPRLLKMAFQSSSSCWHSSQIPGLCLTKNSHQQNVKK